MVNSERPARAGKLWSIVAGALLACVFLFLWQRAGYPLFGRGRHEERIAFLEQELESQRNAMQSSDAVPIVAELFQRNRGTLRKGNLAMCWGELTVAEEDGYGPWNRGISGTFPFRFQYPPRVIVSIQGMHAGEKALCWGQYATQVTYHAYEGRILAFHRHPEDNIPRKPVVTYLAIGEVQP